MKELPDNLKELWKWFINLHNSRSSNGFGINPISYTEQRNYFELIGVSPNEIELDIIKRLDMVALEEFSAQVDKAKPKTKTK